MITRKMNYFYTKSLISDYHYSNKRDDSCAQSLKILTALLNKKVIGKNQTKGKQTR